MRRRGDDAAVADEDGVAVGRGLGGDVRGDRAPCPGTVLDDELLPEGIAPLRREHARERVRITPGASPTRTRTGFCGQAGAWASVGPYPAAANTTNRNAKRFTWREDQLRLQSVRAASSESFPAAGGRNRTRRRCRSRSRISPRRRCGGACPRRRPSRATSPRKSFVWRRSFNSRSGAK